MKQQKLRDLYKVDIHGRIRIPTKISEKWKDSSGDIVVEVSIEYGRLYVKRFRKENVENSPFTGIVRITDKMKRICLPIEYRKLLNIKTDDIFEFAELDEGNKLMLISIKKNLS